MKKVLVGMSGGVDSSVAALLLKNDGYDVIGATMVLFKDDKITNSCLSSNSVIDAKKVCDQLGIKHCVIDLQDIFKKYVIDDFITNYKNGNTPNPCVVCNKYLKFGALWEKAKELGCDYIATGHYAKSKDGKLMCSSSINKDQTYFLNAINKDVLNHIIFPLEDYEDKEEIRKIALANDLFVAEKKDSEEICFIPNDDYKEFLSNNLDSLPEQGDFIDKDGNILGKHKGVIYYTIGQRKGLGISWEKPLYVIDINMTTNEITLGEEKELYKSELIATNINLLVDSLPNELYAKVRFRSKASKAIIEYLDNDKIKVKFEEPQRAITKGQSVVFYKDNICLGGGIIGE